MSSKSLIVLDNGPNTHQFRIVVNGALLTRGTWMYMHEGRRAFVDRGPDPIELSTPYIHLSGPSPDKSIMDLVSDLFEVRGVECIMLDTTSAVIKINYQGHAETMLPTIVRIITGHLNWSQPVKILTNSLDFQSWLNDLEVELL